MTLVQFLLRHPELAEKLVTDLDEMMTGGSVREEFPDRRDLILFFRGYVLGWVGRMEKLARKQEEGEDE